MSRPALTPGLVFARRLANERKRQRLTQEQLADRCAELHANISRATVAKIEAGGTRAQNISLEDVIILAAALGTSPAVLFLPIGVEDDVRIVPSLEVHPHLAMGWIEGIEPLRSHNIRTWHESVEPLRLYRDFRLLQREMHKTRSQVRSAEYVRNDERLMQAREEYADALRQLDDFMQTMARRGVRPAELHEDVMEDMRAIGIDPWTEDRNPQ